MSPNTLMALEQGRVSDPGVFLIARVAQGLGVNVDELLAAAERSEGERMTTGIVSVGYEGREIEEFVADLAQRGVAVLADVRLTPISRKAGFSKTKLADALARHGITYRHYGELGNPKANRAAFASSPDVGRAVFSEVLDAPDARTALDELANSSASEVVAVLCFERDHGACHRQVVVDAVLTRTKVEVVEA